jgi:hypothetical protein
MLCDSVLEIIADRTVITPVVLCQFGLCPDYAPVHGQNRYLIQPDRALDAEYDLLQSHSAIGMAHLAK